MTDRMTWLCLLLVGVLALNGCGGDDSDKGSADSDNGGTATAPADTPKAVCVNFIKSVKAGDEKMFLDCLSYDKSDEDMIVAMFGMLSAAQKLQTRAIDAYGPEGAKILVKQNTFPTTEEVEAEVRIEESGDTAKAYMPQNEKPLDLVKVDGVWKVTLTSNELPPLEQRPQAMKMMGIMVGVMNDAGGKIGKEGYTVEKIETEMKADMQKAMMEAMQEAQPAEPARPDQPTEPAQPE